MNKQKFSIEKNLYKLKNGYILEIDSESFDGYFSKKSKSVFATFYTEYKGNFIIQKIKAFPDIRRDKYQDTYEPYVEEIKHGDTSKEELSSLCLDKLFEVTRKEHSKHHKIRTTKKEKHINKTVQNYFDNELYSFITNPIFNEHIN